MNTTTRRPCPRARTGGHVAPRGQRGIALFATMIIVIITGLLALSSLRQTELTEVLAGNSIQRSRALQAAEGGLREAERHAVVMARLRIFSSEEASNGLFSSGSVAPRWWRDGDYAGARTLQTPTYPGIVEPPVYVAEEIGNYVSDGGSGIVSLDRGAARYGRKTSDGREIVLYRLQSSGVGSSTAARAIVESLYAHNL